MAKKVQANKSKEGHITLKQRLAAFKNLPAFFRLIWETSHWVTITNAILRIISAMLPLALLYVGKLIIDQIILLTHNQGHAVNTHIWLLIFIEFGLALVADILNRGIYMMDGLLGDLFSNHTSIKIMEHAAILDLDQFEDSTFYDKLERARQQTQGRAILLGQIFGQVQDCITIIFLAVGMLAFNPWLILLLFVAILPSFLAESYFNEKNYALSRKETQERRELEYIRYLGASYETAKEIKMFDLSDYLIGRFRRISTQFFEAARNLSLRRASWGAAFAMLGSCGYYVAYAVIVIRTINGHLSVGDLTFLAGSFRQMRGLLEGILTRFNTVSQGAMYLRDFFDFFEIKPKILAKKDARPFPKPIKQGFTFEDVGFKYQHSERWANRHLNFTLHPGEKLALVGENGAGKTTLVKLLTRLYDPTEGRILLDGYDLKDYSLAEIRAQTGVIFQDYLRYQMSFAQNIAVGSINARNDRPRIVRAAQKSRADLLAEKLPDKYDQALGRHFNDGIELSGGEWQKIALARAYMRDGQLLILDEPTSALDIRAESEVFERFAELSEDRSAVFISHRFSTVRMADRILLLEKGEIAELGNHEELMAKGGRYAELFNLQAVGYK